MYKYFLLFSIILVLLKTACSQLRLQRPEDKTKCPRVKAIRNFDLQQILGKWYVIEYYASSEEALSYKCMRAEFTLSNFENVNMNFTYSFVDDPKNEMLLGNISWIIPVKEEPAHWVHSEDTYEGIYNTYILDSDYISWALLLHCAEKSKMTRYLSSFIISREMTLGKNVISFLREKLPVYDIDLSFMYDMQQADCDSTPTDLPPSLLIERPNVATRRHPMKNHHGT